MNSDVILRPRWNASKALPSDSVEFERYIAGGMTLIALLAAPFFLSRSEVRMQT